MYIVIIMYINIEKFISLKLMYTAIKMDIKFLSLKFLVEMKIQRKTNSGIEIATTRHVLVSWNC